MPAPARLALLVLVALAPSLGLPAAARAATELLSSRRVRVVVDKDNEGPREGYLTLSVRAENLTSSAQRVELRFEGRPTAQVEASLPLAPGEVRVFPLLLPAAARFGTLVASDGAQEGREGFSWSWQGHDAVLVEGLTAAQPLLSGSKSAKGAGGGSANGPVVAVARGELPATLAGLVGYGGVGVLESRLEDLPEPQRRALEAYAATGGRLFLAQAPTQPRALLPLWPSPDQSRDQGEIRYGFGSVHLCADPAACAEALGHLPDLKRPASASSGPVSSRRHRGAVSQEPGEPLLDVARVPVGGFLLLVLAFVLVLGPGSFVVRARKGPHALLVFVPLTALVTCGGIAGYGVASEGLFTLHASSVTATLLDTVHHRAVTVSVDGYYASLGPSQVRYGALEAVVLSQEDSNPGLRLDVSDGVTFRGGLIPSRSYREHLTLAVAPSRARLSVRDLPSGDQPPTVENALGARLLDGGVRVGQRLCRISAVDDQGRGATTCSGAADGAWLREAVGGALGARFQTNGLADGLLRDLAEGEFLVVLDRAVFAPDGGLTLSRRGDRQLVRGRVFP